MGRQENVEIFKDTEYQVKNIESLKKAVTNSMNRQRVYLENDIFPEVEKNRFQVKAQIVVSKKRTLQAALAYKNEKVCVHNFASATNPGGGVLKGSGAQEECLCRCSTLYFNLSCNDMFDKFYTPHRKEKNPIHNDDCIYTPDVVVFKTDTNSPKNMQEKDWYKVNVITCAAPNLRPNPTNMMNESDGDKQVKLSNDKLYELHVSRLRRILDVALLNNNDVVVLGAFGCGAFRNNPNVVAMAARDVIKDYMYSFKTIEFAVYCSPRDNSNYKIFENTIQ